MTETQLTEDSALTYENILKLFKETDKQFKETEKRIKEIAEKSKETDERLDKRIKETDERLDKRIKKTDARFKEVAESFKEVAKESKETKRIVKETNRSIGALGNKWGEFIEGLVAPAALRLFKERGYEVNEIYQKVRAPEKGDMEIDILVINRDIIILIEVKSTLNTEDINDHLERLANFKNFFPRYKEKKVLGAVAGIIVNDKVKKYAYRKGLFVITQKGDSVQILNDEKFKAREW